MSSDNDNSSEDDKGKTKRWDGTSSKLEDFDKRFARWCRRRYGTEIGNLLWSNDIPDFVAMNNTHFRAYYEKVSDGINDGVQPQPLLLRAVVDAAWK